MVDWPKIGFGGGAPITGDAGQVDTLASNLNGVAEAIEAQLLVLDEIDSHANEIWDSSSATGFREAAAELPDLLGKVRDRYEGAARVMDTYKDALEAAIDRMEQWGGIAEDRHDTVDEAERALAQREQDEQDEQDEIDDWNRQNPGEPPRTASPSELSRYQQDVADAKADFDAAVEEVREAVDDKDTAGDTAERDLAEINDDDLENDRGFFEGIARWVSDTLNLPAWADLLRIVASVVSIAALLLCWVPVLGPILGAVALVLNVALLLVDTVLAVSGQGSWWNVAISALGVVTGGLGRAAATGARASAHAYRFARGGIQLANRGGVMRYPAQFAPHTTARAQFFANSRPWSNFPEVADHLSVVRNGRNLPAGLGGHQPGYWNAFRANAAQHGRNWVGLGGPAAFAFNVGDATRRLGVWPSVGHAPFGGGPLQHVPNPHQSTINFNAHSERDRAAEYADGITPVAPTPVPVP